MTDAADQEHAQCPVRLFMGKLKQSYQLYRQYQNGILPNGDTEWYELAEAIELVYENKLDVLPDCLCEDAALAKQEDDVVSEWAAERRKLKALAAALPNPVVRPVAIT